MCVFVDSFQGFSGLAGPEGPEGKPGTQVPVLYDIFSHMLDLCVPVFVNVISQVISHSTLMLTAGGGKLLFIDHLFFFFCKN